MRFFPSDHSRRIRFGLVALILTAGPALGQAFEPNPGDAIEVREGDVWSSAELVGREGRRWQIRYADGTEEWITADRLRAPGSASGDAGEGPADPDTDAPEPEPQPVVRRFKSRQQVEFKVHSRWQPATVKRVVDDLYLVATNDGFGDKEFFWKWVDADRLRAPGEDHEGPDTFSQFEERVGNDSIRDSLRDARKSYKAHLAKQAQTPRTESGRADPFAPPPASFPTTEADRSTLQTLGLRIGVGPADLTPDPADGPDFLQRPVAITLRNGKGRSSITDRVAVSRGRFALAVIEDRPSGSAKALFAERVDLKNGRSIAATAFDFASMPVAISPNGNRIAGRSNGFHSGSFQRLDLWDWSGREPQHQLSFRPADAPERERDGDIDTMQFITDDRLLVLTEGGDLSVWDAESGRGVWEVTGLVEPGDVCAEPRRALRGGAARR